MEIKTAKYELVSDSKGVLHAKITGFLKDEDLKQYISDYNKVKASMVVRKKVVVDCTIMAAVPQSILADIVELLKVYQRDFGAIGLIPPKSTTMMIQVEKSAKAAGITYTVEK